MEQKQYNPLENAEFLMEQNAKLIDGVLNNLPPEPEKDKVKEPPAPARTLEREER